MKLFKTDYWNLFIVIPTAISGNVVSVCCLKVWRYSLIGKLWCM